MKHLANAKIPFAHLSETIRSHYGSGASGLVKFLYFSLLRVNTFVVFCQNCQHGVATKNNQDPLTVERKALKVLEHVRKSKELPKEFYCDKTHGTSDFFLGIWDGVPAYIHWVFHSGSKSRFLEIGKGCCEINYMLTLPDFRKKKICTKVIQYTTRLLAKDGIKMVYCVVHSQNVASIKAVQRAGMVEFKRIKSLGPFNFRIKVKAP